MSIRQFNGPAAAVLKRIQIPSSGRQWSKVVLTPESPSRMIEVLSSIVPDQDWYLGWDHHAYRSWQPQEGCSLSRA
jgi:hypothetical protein